jgi:demethylmenaquinone methyltransferase/2-methoxy-6-polyprenyl-1,4-benzoquinol methylase
MKSTIQNKTKLVNSVFSQVYKKYDLMNDIMSFGAHRVWKSKLLDWMNPQINNTLVDVASGTGDIAKIFSRKINHSSEISCVEPNTEMYIEGKNSLKNFKNIKWFKASAEKLPFKENSFDFYTISYGLRNVSNINLALKEANRVLKPGGRFLCLEFSKVDNEIINLIYQKYSKIIPLIGKYVVGSSKPYDYLIRSINEFYTQNELKNLIKKHGFCNVEYRNLSNGISAIHSGWKI